MKDWKSLVNYFSKREQRYKDCSHKFSEKPVGITSTGRFGGKAIHLYKCEKCGMMSSFEDLQKNTLQK